jgi:hypothetical protein
VLRQRQLSQGGGGGGMMSSHSPNSSGLYPITTSSSSSSSWGPANPIIKQEIQIREVRLLQFLNILPVGLLGNNVLKDLIWSNRIFKVAFY